MKRGEDRGGDMSLIHGRQASAGTGIRTSCKLDGGGGEEEVKGGKGGTTSEGKKRWTVRARGRGEEKKNGTRRIFGSQIACGK